MVSAEASFRGFAGNPMLPEREVWTICPENCIVAARRGRKKRLKSEQIQREKTPALPAFFLRFRPPFAMVFPLSLGAFQNTRHGNFGPAPVT